MSEKQPTRYELIAKDGTSHGEFHSAAAAAQYAKMLYPTEDQDHDRTGNGWDVQVMQPR